MPKHSLVLLVAALILLAAGSILVPQFLADDSPPPLRWSEHEEVELEALAPADAGAAVEGAVDRTEIDAADGSVVRVDDARVEVLLRGRVVDRFGAPQAGAKVWLDFGRGGARGGQGGRQRRVPDPVETDREGRFAFAGQTFRSLRVSLQVLHPGHAPTLFDKDVGQVQGEVDLGDLVIERGGELVGRVTDLEHNGIAGATVELLPENDNRMRFLRDRDNLLPSATTDSNGYYRRANVPAGDWSVTAVVKMHTEGRSAVFAVENEQQVDVEDIRLGPGFELTGIVVDAAQKPIADAEVSLRGDGTQARGGGGRGGRGPGARDHRTTTDKQGRFFLEHLPGVPMQLDVRADGYLPFQQEDVDAKLGQPLHVTLQEGLRITGVVVDEDGTPVPMYAVRAVRVRGLPVPGLEGVDPAQLFARMRSGDLSDSEREALRTQMEQFRNAAGDMRRGPGGGGRPGGGRQGGNDANELGRPEAHAGGRFVVAGLQEGVYELHVQSPDHARSQSNELELRLGAPAPDVRVQLDSGVYVAGVVRDDRDIPVANAQVSLRTPPPARPGRNNGGGNTPDFAAIGRDFARQFAGAQLNVEATTNVDGEFVLKHVPRGTYRLQAAADSYADASIEPFELTGDRSAVVLRLGALGAIVGQVQGFAKGEEGDVRVAAVPLNQGGAGPGMFRGRGPGGGGGGPFRNGTVAADGSYRIDGLAAGDYIVRSWIGSPQELMRELMPQWADGSLAADVNVRGGEETKWNLVVQRAQVGSVAGSVLHNGSPGVGLQVELVRVEANGGDGTNDNRGGPGGPGGRGMWGNFGRSQQATVAASGRFKIDNVPAGDYRLRVQSGRRGGLLHEELVTVAADVTTERDLSLQTVSIAGTVTVDDGSDPKQLNGRISLLRGLVAVPDDLQAWQRDNPSFETRLQDGAFRFESIQPGSYLLMLTVRGRETTSQPVQIGSGGAIDVTIAAGKVRSPASPAAPGANPTPRRPTLR